ncbi:MAG: UDP-N-acetylglucosamine--N-acetylmuramyl-(pentapeptide) pyrophosphoryl-undecaprenol N-acetylglucosamine transferase [Candidatus Daviesbacteria bacterium]|nr:UDP-N-acetylglucosamine--N-acetylmuramyl-(pentapeptide) pyrophosphoryl-undecaprenol N-acetylglucosamine transferase [Candidatus Daviesbacteria bacterium]
MKILVTGAHFTPAVAVIEELKKFDGAKIVYVGRRTTLEGDGSASPESQVLPALGVKFIPIITGRLQRSFTIYTIPSLFKIPVGFIQALYIILSEKPDVILSFGGYVAVPVVIAGWLFSIPIIIHEQTLVSGLANKISAFCADKIAVSFEPDVFKSEKVILTGNPIRREIVEISQGVKLTHPRGGLEVPTILIMGGNQGSHIINLAVEEVLNKLTKLAYVIHATGDNKYGDFERLESLGRFGERYLVKKWIGKGYGAILKKADLVISRAGINTLTELAYLGKPALVIPIPYLYQDEQNKNAGYFEKLGLVRILPQSKLSAEALFKNIRVMLSDLNQLIERAKKAKKVIVPDAAKRLALETMLLAKNPEV